MLLMLLEKNCPLDEVMFYDTGMEFKAIYHVREKILAVLRKNNILYTELKPEKPFLYDMLERPVYSKQKGHHYGYGWCGGLCRWGTTNKLKALDGYAKAENAIVYIGLAADEPKRLVRMADFKRAPLAEWNITEAQALRYCRNQGILWNENGVNLYDILDRVSCWCCCNKNKKELYNIRKYLPDYWKKLIELQSKIERPMKKFRTDAKFGDLGNIINLENYLKESENCEQNKN